MDILKLRQRAESWVSAACRGASGFSRANPLPQRASMLKNARKDRKQDRLPIAEEMPIFKTMTVQFPFQNTYTALPAGFFARVAPTPVASPRLIKLNRALAINIGLDPDRLSSPEGAESLAGKRVRDGSDPIAMAYAGHQFGHFVPQPSDGRAILL